MYENRNALPLGIEIGPNEDGEYVLTLEFDAIAAYQATYGHEIFSVVASRYVSDCCRSFGLDDSLDEWLSAIQCL
jgi:hypothetical protein